MLPGFEPPAPPTPEERAVWMLKSMVNRAPPSSGEWDLIISGLRLCRFVSGLECEKCNFQDEDHTLTWVFKTKICLKDYFALRQRLGMTKLNHCPQCGAWSATCDGKTIKCLQCGLEAPGVSWTAQALNSDVSDPPGDGFVSPGAPEALL